MGLAEAFGMDVEIQCWGYTLTQAANLHVMLGFRQLPLFRAAVALSGLRVWRARRHPHGPRGLRQRASRAGLGIELDWEAIERASILSYDVRG